MNKTGLTHGLWAHTAKNKPDFNTLQGEAGAEVAIIGGGYTGLSAALHLAKAGTSCVVLEANDVGFGGAGRNVGLVNAGLWLMPEDVISLVGQEHGETLIKVLGASPDLVYGLVDQYNMDCEAWRHGTLHCADSGAGYKALQERERQWQKLSAPVRLLDRDEAAAKIGSKKFRGALLDERAGTVQPLKYAYGLAHAAAKEGATIYTGSPVIKLDQKNGSYILSTPNGRLVAAKVIVAVQGYPERAFAGQIKGIVPFNYFQFATKPLDPETLSTVLPDRNGCWDTNLILTSFRLDENGRFVFGSVGSLDGFAWELNRAWTLRTIARLFPQIKDVALEFGWYGRIAMTTNHIPRFHVMDRNMAMVTCYNGRGIGPGTVFGKLMADYIMDGDTSKIPLPVSPISPVGLRVLRGLFYEAGSRLYHFVQRRV